MDPQKPIQLDYEGSPSKEANERAKAKKLHHSMVFGVLVSIAPALALPPWPNMAAVDRALLAVFLEMAALALLLLAGIIYVCFRSTRARGQGLLLAVPIGGLISWGICAVAAR